MMSPRIILPILLAIAVPAPLRAQPQEAPKVVIVDTAAKELKRAAARLRIPAAQLRKARTALEEASAVAGQIEAPSPSSFGQLARLWIDLDRPKASAKLDALAVALRRRAEEAEDPSLHVRCTAAAQQILPALGQVDPERAVALARSWPAPRAESYGPDGAPLKAGLRRQLEEQLAYRDPDRALALLDDVGSASYTTRGRIAAQLYRSGRKDEALRLADGVTADFAKRDFDAGRLNDFQIFTASLAEIDPDRTLAAFQLLGRAGTGGPVSITRVGDQSLPLTRFEQAQLAVLHYLQSRPELALKAVGVSSPELKAKLDAAGGIDRALATSYNVPSTGVQIIQPGMGLTITGTASADPALIAELRGKALKDPAYVRQVLARKAHDPETLMVLAQRVNQDDPELASLALERAAVLLPETQPADKRARQIQMFLGVGRQIEGEVDPAVFKQGFLAVDELREAGSASPSFADTLEVALVAAYARVDFDAALGFARTLSDTQRLAALIQIAETLRSSF
jgi:hypothetical protein